MSDLLSILAPSDGDLKTFFSAPLLSPFESSVLSFLNDLSEFLLKDSVCRQHSELVALGFWLRRAHIQKLDSELNAQRKPLGTVVHFTPANVDTMFIYSWVCSLLMGNRNLIRIASQPSELQSILFRVINDALSKSAYTAIAKANLLVRYEKQSHWSATLSEQADARIIWGGDDSVQSIRALSVKPRTRDISFADRLSASWIDLDCLSDEGNLNRAAELLWKDLHPYGQQACSSPRILYWKGSELGLNRLAAKLNELASKEQTKNQLNNHLVYSQLLQAKGQVSSPLIIGAACVLPVNAITPDTMDDFTGNGVLLTLRADNAEAIAQQLPDKMQTLTHYKISESELLKLAQDPSINGIDRIVPLGQALAFEPEWDGYDLFSQLSRNVQLIL